MELHCLPTETPTTASSCSTDPLYDNCPPFAQRERGREKEMESRVVCPAVTRLPGSCSPLPGLAPAVAEVQAVVGGGRGPGAWPGHSYCSCRGGLGRLAWEAELGPGMNRARGGERGGEQGCSWGAEDRTQLSQNPSRSESEEHRSALSLYDNLPDTVTDSLQEASDMETSLQEHLQEQMYQAWTPEQIQGLMEGDDVSEERSPWSSCEIVLAKSCSSNQDQDKEQEPELDSGSCGFLQGELMLHPQTPMSPPEHLTANSPQLCHSKPALGAEAPKQPSWSPRVPPPVPLADPSASALRSLLTSLQQQIVRQREEYEARIISLEQRNEELQVEVVRLKTNLTQQRHWYQAVQIKIAESEKARSAAELHNATLQREMEQFFDTFGELNNEAKKTEYIVKSF
ncbi:uncharacterized protein LOC110948126 [Acanthochromis polyacanthus]|uniref:uncharacterized protein LOC110948126 n=1 Tax=Acanthochromis polyacanthus TaxID=80966 RepID=UPI000B8F8C8C|nr:uncharacterized protein LOC110948126 [Acanthochromis polyacanthus]